MKGKGVMKTYWLLGEDTSGHLDTDSNANISLAETIKLDPRVEDWKPGSVTTLPRLIEELV